jgi:2-oxoglutarate ferredoxin oxidoreductase subunit beta
MDTKVFDMGDIDIAWCPGCGNFSVLDILKQSLSELGMKPQTLVLVSGIGQAAKTPHYLKTNVFNGLHGRSLPAATTIKLANPHLTVIAESGDGCMYAEGGNHFLHTVRRNPDIAMIVHNNMVYGLTKGQASPTSRMGFRTPVQVRGVVLEPFNPVAVAVALDASFVARAYCGDKKETKEILKKAILHRGFAVVDVFQPCVTYNRVNTYKWFKENTYYLEDSYDPQNRQEAFRKATEKEKYALGVIYTSRDKTSFEENVGIYGKNGEPLYKRQPRRERLYNLIDLKRKM